MTGRSFPSGFAKYWGFERAINRFFGICPQSDLWLLECRLAQAVSAMVSRYPPTCPRRGRPALFRRSGLEFYALFRRLFFHWAMGWSAPVTPPRSLSSVAQNVHSSVTLM